MLDPGEAPPPLPAGSEQQATDGLAEVVRPGMSPAGHVLLKAPTRESGRIDMPVMVRRPASAGDLIASPGPGRERRIALTGRNAVTGRRALTGRSVLIGTTAVTGRRLSALGGRLPAATPGAVASAISGARVARVNKARTAAIPALRVPDGMRPPGGRPCVPVPRPRRRRQMLAVVLTARSGHASWSLSYRLASALISLTLR